MMKEEAIITYYFVEDLKGEIKDEVLIFLQKNNDASIEQDPLWNQINNPLRKIMHFYALRGKELVCYSNIVENKMMAQIHLGPVFEDNGVLLSSLVEIKKYYKQKGFAQLEIQLGIPTGQDSDCIEYSLYQLDPFVQKFDVANWSTIAIKLDRDIDEIFKSFKKNHKGSIKKALKEGLTVREIDTSKDIENFASLYDRMYKARNIVKSFPDTKDVFSKLSTMFLDQKNGKILSVFDANNTMIGGVVLGRSSREMYYKYGASDPDYKKLPILHLALFEGIKLAREEGLDIFNFGGYNHFVKEGDQVYAINFFKRSFSGEFIFYPKKMYFKLNKIKFFIFNILRFAYRKFNSLRK